MNSEGLVRTWLFLQTAVFSALVGLFAVVFPIGGAMLWLLQLSPSGEDPLGPALAMGIAGPLTALVYLPGALTAPWAIRRLRAGLHPARTPVIIAVACSAVMCGALIAVPIIIVANPESSRRSDRPGR